MQMQEPPATEPLAASPLAGLEEEQLGHESDDDFQYEEVEVPR